MLLGGGGRRGKPPPVAPEEEEEETSLVPRRSKVFVEVSVADFFPGMAMEKVCPSFKLKSFLGPTGRCGEGLSSSIVASDGFLLALQRLETVQLSMVNKNKLDGYTLCNPGAPHLDLSQIERCFVEIFTY